MLIPIRNLQVSNDKSNFENYLVTATEARYEYRGTEPFSNKRKRALPRSGCVSAIPGYVLYEFSRYPGSDSLIQPVPAKTVSAILTSFKIAIRYKIQLPADNE